MTTEQTKPTETQPKAESVDPTVTGADDLVETTGLPEVSGEDFPPEGPMEATTQAVELATISRQDILLRAQSWIDEHVMYNQHAYHTNKYGRYRQDCSGYVSMCWHLPTSYTTENIMKVKVAHKIARNELAPGDALWHRVGDKGHIALFVGWADTGHTKPVVDEERQPGEPCERKVWTHQVAAGFTPIRYNSIA